jgi:dipeptidyl-peptidase-4
MPEKGTHSVSFSFDYEYFIDYFNNLETPLNIVLRNTKNDKSQLLLAAKNPYRSLKMTQTNLFAIRNKSGDSLNCRIILPPDFNPAKKYPCLIYVYGGPHSQLVTNTFMSGGVFLHYLAQKGYIIFTLDNRGTANQGAEFEKAIHRRLGVLEMEDQLCGVDYLKSLPYIDPDRIGLDGWSYGGFMVLTLISEHPELFRSASCGGPVVNWEWYEVMYGERYMDTPESNPEGYAKANIIPKVGNITCDLLVMHGAHDHTVMWQHSLELLRQSVTEGVEIDYFVYPTHDHNVIGMERVHLWKKIERFHDIHLKGICD